MRFLFISDNGCGWPMALADSLMKPFTTSKEIGLDRPVCQQLHYAAAGRQPADRIHADPPRMCDPVF